MPDLIVCTGPEFGRGSLGELRVANTRAVTWPYSSSPATAAAQMAAANALRFDGVLGTPAGGLWVPQVAPSGGTVRQSATPATVVPVGAAVVEDTLTAVPFTNPSAVQVMGVKCTMTWQSDVTVGGSTWAELWTGATLSVGSPAIPWFAQDSNAAGASTFIWHSSVTEALYFTVPVSSALNLLPRIGVKNFTGSAALAWTGWRFIATWSSWLIDPVTAG